MHAGGTGTNHMFHQFERIQIAAEARFGIGDDRCQPVDRIVPIERMNLVGAEERIVDPFDHFGH